MALIKWNPWLFWPNFDLDFEEFPFPSKIAAKTDFITPAVDVYETKDSVVVESPLAGVKPEDVEINVKENVLTIKGKSEEKKEIKKENYFRKEIRTGSIFRSVTLPCKVIEEKAEASSENGMLKVSIPKAQPEKKAPVKIKVKVEKKK